MPTNKQKQEEYTSHWISRIEAADKHFEKWESKFKCKTLERYIEGFQITGNLGYVLNLFYSSIKVKKPSLLFSRPTFSLIPKPWKTDWNPETSFTTSRLKEDTLNSFISELRLDFSQEVDMAILDSWSYFGIMEVGYSANWIKNPNAGKPALKRDYYDLKPTESEGKILVEPDEIPEKEYVYFKRIPAHRFRVGGSDSHDLGKCNWCGYYEFVRTSDLLANKKFLKNLDEKDWPSSRSDDYYFEDGQSEDNRFTGTGDYTKLWKIWDNRQKKFLMIIQDPEKCIFEEDFKRLPLFPLRFDLRRKGFYPIPATFNWKGAQDELNESREQMRRHRRRVRNIWQATEGSIDPDEIDKFIEAPDGTLIRTKREGAIQPIQNATIDSSVVNSLQITSAEFDKISGTSDNQRGVSNRTTATEANTIEARTRIREETDQTVVAEWLCAIGKEALLTIVERFSEPFWIKLNQDEGEIGDEIQDIRARYKLIHAAMLNDSGDFDVNISVTSMSPVTNEVEKKKFFEFMAILQQYSILSLHPTVIREAAYRCDYRNEQVIKALQQMSQLSMMAKIEEGQANQAGGNGGQLAQQQVANSTPPAQEEIRQQIEPQVM